MKKITLILGLLIMSFAALYAQNPTSCTPDPLFEHQWGLHNTRPQGAGIDISACNAWNYSEGEGVKVAIIYCYGFLDYPQLPIDIAKNIPELTMLGIMNPGFATKHETMQQYGIIAAMRNDREFVGVAPKCKLYPIYVRDLYHVPEGIEEALNKGVDIILLPFQEIEEELDQPLVPPIKAAIQHARTTGRNGKGCVIIAPSGDAYIEKPLFEDPSKVKFPASIPQVIAVGGITPAGYRVTGVTKNDPSWPNPIVYNDRHSCYGTALDVVAPGEYIYSTMPYRYQNNINDYLNSFGRSYGTQHAAAYVAGVAALILAVNPCLTEHQVRQIIYTSCRKLTPQYIYITPPESTADRARNIETGYGLVNAYECVRRAIPDALQTDVININTTWDSDYRIAGNVVINSGKTLTIKNATIQIAKDRSITLKPGASLVIDGATLTNLIYDCIPERMWQGIIIEGDPTKPMGGQHQGVVTIKNKGTIENAECGIFVEGGGMVNAHTAYFINNTTGVFFQPLSNGQKGNSGTFRNTFFELNDDYLDDMTDFMVHLKMQSSGSVAVYGCTFSSTAPGNLNNNMGIYAFNTDLDVREDCPSGSWVWPTGFCDDTKDNTFKGLSRAISVYNTGTLPKIKIRFSIFDDNFLDGIYVNGVNYPELIKNKFFVNKSYAHGAALLNATGYKIEENTFISAELCLDEKTTGLWIHNSGSAENEVYKNVYENLYVAQQFSDKNDCRFNSHILEPGAQSRFGGLQTLCNVFKKNRSEDVFVGGNIIPTRQSSIREHQGSWQKSAGNRFNDHPTLTIININNTSSQYAISYWYTEDIPEEKPNNVTNSVYLNTAGFNACPSKLGSVTGGGGIPNALAQYSKWDSEYEKWLGILIASDGKDEEALDMVSYYSALKDNLFNSIIVETFDGDDGELDQDSIIKNLRYLFSYRGNYTDYLSIVETYLAENDYKQALAILTTMYSQFATTPEETMELDGLEIYIQWLQKLEDKGMTIYELPVHELGYLTGYVQSNTGRGVVFANIILCELYKICIEEEEAPTGGGEMITGVEDPRESVSSASSAFQKSALENITLYPNPTTGELTITNDELRITSIEIFDVYGRKINSKFRIQNSEFMTNISHLNPGIYFIKITTAAGEVVKKVIKQ